MAALSIFSAGPEMDVRIREKVGALRGVIQRIQPYAHHHEFFIAVPDEKLQELLDWRAMLLGVERHIKAAVPFSTGSSPSEPWPRKVSPSRSDATARERAPGGTAFRPIAAQASSLQSRDDKLTSSRVTEVRA